MAKNKTEYRIDGFEQIRRFYSLVFNGEVELRTSHVSLYFFLLQQNNRNMWAEWFKCPFDLAMTGGCIGSRQTYYKALKHLQESKLIKYIPGVNDWKAPRISIIPLMSKNEHQPVPLCEPLLSPLFDNQDGKEPVKVSGQVYEQVFVQLPEQVSEHIYKQITIKLNNYTTSNWENLKTNNLSQFFIINKDKVYELKNYFEEKFPGQTEVLKKNYGADFYERIFKEFSDGNIEREWKDDQDIRNHFSSYIKLKSQNKSKNINGNHDSDELSIQELKDKYSA